MMSIHASVFSQHQQLLDLEYLKVCPYYVILIFTLTASEFDQPLSHPADATTSAALWGRKTPRLSTPTTFFFSYFKLLFHKFYCHQILALQDLVKISADSAFSDSDSNHTLCDFMNYNFLSQLIDNTIPSSFYFAVPLHVQSPGGRSWSWTASY